ncbi:hypothetical protein BSL78_29051 [Apostichopus japonicus]|uniref:Uncharacterized protein n=1 Tax=Stichopus japonicus TaxID=307972 RepID=A0A2G8JEF0_STIJA|nr:hypothetical protein BSL78_29051 [Apostichopus japonicus]
MYRCPENFSYLSLIHLKQARYLDGAVEEQHLLTKRTIMNRRSATGRGRYLKIPRTETVTLITKQTPLVIAIMTIPMCITKQLIEDLVPRNERDHQLKDRDFALVKRATSQRCPINIAGSWKCRSATPEQGNQPERWECLSTGNQFSVIQMENGLVSSFSSTVLQNIYQSKSQG